MQNQTVLDELLSILEAKGVIIRTEAMGGRGTGLCKMKGKAIFFMDSDASTAELAAGSAVAVAETVNIEEIYLKPATRQLIEESVPDPF